MYEQKYIYIYSYLFIYIYLLKCFKTSSITIYASDGGFDVQSDKLPQRPHISQWQSQSPIWFSYIAFCFSTQIEVCLHKARRLNWGSYGEEARHKRSTQNFSRTLLQLVRFHRMTSSLNIPPNKPCPHITHQLSPDFPLFFEVIFLPHCTWKILVHYFKV